MRLFKEWARRKNDRTGTMVPVEQIDNIVKYVNNPGYASVYSFKEEDAKQIIASGMSRDFDRFETYADQLPIDLDDGDKTLPILLEKVKGYKYDLYSSGGKGYHIILHHQPMLSMDLPYSHRNVVESFGIPYDKSLYQPGRIFRLPGCIHEKTGKRKELVERVDGDLISVEVVKKPEILFNFKGGLEGDMEAALINLLSLKTNPPKMGTRHLRTWQVATDLMKAGFDRESVGQFLVTINTEWPEPQPEDEILAAVDQAARRLGNG